MKNYDLLEIKFKDTLDLAWEREREGGVSVCLCGRACRKERDFVFVGESLSSLRLCSIVLLFGLSLLEYAVNMHYSVQATVSLSCRVGWLAAT